MTHNDQQKRELLEIKLNNLQQEYRHTLKQRLQQINELLFTLKEHNWQQVTLQQLKQELHSLDGSSGSFQFHDISLQSCQLEKIISALTHETLPPKSENITQIETAFSCLKDSINNAITASSPQSKCLTDNKTQNSKYQETSATILIINATEESYQQLELFLSPHGFAIITANQRENIKSLIEKHKPIAIIHDSSLLNEPLAGIKKIAQLRSQLRSQLKDTVCLFISSEDDITTRMAAIKAGGEGYFTQPVNFNELVEQLIAILEKRKLKTDIKVLVIDDDSMLTEQIALVLEHANMYVNCINEPSDLVTELNRFQPNIILMDLHMPLFSGIELAVLIRQIPEYSLTPIVFLSSERDSIEQYKALAHGGNTFLTKPIASDRLIAEISSRIIRSKLSTTQ
jgi:DNA-binding response OmpR family regulator